MAMGDNDATSLVRKITDAKRKQDQDVLSAEDLAWADSCLIEDPEISETNLDSLKEALLDILGQHSEIIGHSANERSHPNDITDPENFPSVTEEETSHTAETSTNEHPENDSPDVLLFSLKKPFLPNYNDEMMNIQYSDADSDTDFVSSELVMEPPSDNIFKVWDLDIPVEEDELVRQLKEALSESSSNAGSKVVSLDDLVDGIADLSLK